RAGGATSQPGDWSDGRGQPVGPDTRCVDDVRGTDVELLTALAVERTDTACSTVAFEQAQCVHAVGTARAEALGLAEDGQDQANVVGLTVIEQISAGRLARGERGQQLDDFLARDHNVAIRTPGVVLLRRGRMAARLALDAARAPAATPTQAVPVH